MKSLISSVAKNKIFILFNLLYAGFFVFSVFNDIKTFRIDTADAKHILNYIIVKFLFLVTCVLTEIYVIYRHKNTPSDERRHFYFIFLSLLIFYLIAFMAYFPGNYNNVDEIKILQDVLNLEFLSTQSIIMSLIYYFGLMIVPKAFSVVLIQIILSSYFIACVFADLYSKLKNKKIIILFFLLFFSIPSVYFVLFPLRAWIFTIVFLLFLYRVFALIRFSKTPTRYDLLFLCISLSLLCLIRTEIKFLLFIFPFIVFYLYKNRNKVRSIVIKAEAFVLCLVMIFSFCQSFIGGSISKGHRLEPFITSISIMAAKGRIPEDDLKILDKVVPVDDLIKYSSPERPFEYKSSARSDDEFTNAEYIDALGVIIKSIIKHPMEFLKSKIIMFVHSTGMEKYYVNLPADENAIAAMYERYNLDKEDIEKYYTPFSPLREKLSSLLMGGYYFFDFYCIFWAFWVPVFLILISALIMFFKDKVKFKPYLIVYILLLMELALVFLFAPASFQMYYFPFYLIGWFFIILCAVDKEKASGLIRT